MTADRATLLSLAALCERGTGPDRDLDEGVLKALGAEIEDYRADLGLYRVRWSARELWLSCRPPTGSIGTVRDLHFRVLPECRTEIEHFDSGWDVRERDADRRIVGRSLGSRTKGGGRLGAPTEEGARLAALLRALAG